MSRLVYFIFMLAVVEASRNTFHQSNQVKDTFHQSNQVKDTFHQNTQVRNNFQQNTQVSTAESNKILKLEAKIKLPPNVTVSGVITFGDSIVDTGNNNNLRTLVKSNFPPYGQDLAGKIASGRFTDGRVPSDLIAESLGIAKTIPAYLDPKLKNEDLLKGVNFASAGSGYDPLTAKLVRVVSLEDQLKYFREYKEKLKVILGQEKAKFMVENSVYFVCSSSNDFAQTYMPRSVRYNRTVYPDLLANMASKFIRELYGLGARRIGVFSAVPVGCVPARRTINGIQRKCSDKLNQMAIQFNAKLSPSLEALGKELPGSKIVYIDVYDTLYDMIQNPKNYGFEVSDRGCCGTGLLEVAILCNKINPFTCKNPSSYLFWDSFHPTEKAYQVIVDKLLGKSMTQLV